MAVAIAVYSSNVSSDFFKEFLSSPNRTACNGALPATEGRAKPTYWIYGGGGEGQWVHVKNVLKKLGFERVTGDESSTADLLWAHDYPFSKIRSKVSEMQPHQKINHFPGSGFITNKVDLCTTRLKFVPRAFKQPADKDEFKKFTDEHPQKRFVVKHYQHRHIKIKKVDEINMNDNNTFIQEFIENPLLVDGYKFDIGVYTIITSIDPLRVYIYNGDILFRYCAQKYHPFDPENVDKYIVGDDYLPTWEIPSLAPLFNNLGHGMKSSFDTYLRNKGQKPEKIWSQVNDAIREAILSKEALISDLMQRYKNKESFFEMMRFDLIVDANLRVYLMEANMSPNLSSAHFKQNSLLYEQVIFNVLNLVGVGHYLQRDSLEKFDKETEMMLSTFKNIAVNGESCSQMPCLESCAPVDCQLCKPCLSHEEITELGLAYREHVNRGDTKRIFPETKVTAGDFEKLSPANQVMTKWFQAKCALDASWC